MTSRFFAGGGSSSESSSEDVTSSESENEQEIGTAAKSRFMLAESSSEDEGPRVVRSKEDKVVLALREKCAEVRSFVRESALAAAQKSFAELDRQLKKDKNVLLRAGLGAVPVQFVKTILLLEDEIPGVNAKDLSKADAKALNALRQTLKKLPGEHAAAAAQARKEGITAESEDDDEGEGEDGALSDAESTDGEDDEAWATAGAKATGASRWMKKDALDESKLGADKKADRQRARAERTGLAAGEEGAERATGKAAKKVKESEVRRELREIQKKRGKLSTDTQAILEQLRALKAHVQSPGLSIEITHDIVTAQLDIVTASGTSKKLMTGAQWSAAAADLDDLISLLNAHPNVVLAEGDGLDDRSVIEANKIVDQVLAEAAKLKGDDEEIFVWDPKKPTPIRGSLVGNLSTLDDEWVRTIRAADPHRASYIELLRLDSRFIDLSYRALDYYKGKHEQISSAVAVEQPTGEAEDGFQSRRTRKATKGSAEVDDPLRMVKREVSVAARILERTYYKRTTSVDSIAPLTSLVYARGDVRQQTRALLQDVFLKAIHDKYFEARDLLLMSHLQETACADADVATQMLFNRAIAALGLAAFRTGSIKQAHTALNDLFGSGRARELLGQGSSANRFAQNQEAEQRRVQEEKLRQLPHHMHFNLELLETVHYTCALLLEVPSMAAAAALASGSSEGSSDPRVWQKRRVISRPFRRLMDHHDRQAFSAGIHVEPERYKDAVVAAAVALQAGNWRRAAELLCGLKAWTLLPTHTGDGEPPVGTRENVKAMLRSRVQVEGLRTYVFHFSQFYRALSLETLAVQFDLPRAQVHNILSKLMINNDINALWDQTTNSVVLNTDGGPSPLLAIAARFAEKAEALANSNERVIEARTGEVTRERTDRDESRRGRGGRGGARGGSSRGGGEGSDRREGHHSGASSNQNNSGQRGGRGGQRGNSRGNSRGRGGRGQRGDNRH